MKDHSGCDELCFDKWVQEHPESDVHDEQPIDESIGDRLRAVLPQDPYSRARWLLAFREECGRGPAWNHAMWSRYDEAVQALPSSGLETAQKAADVPDQVVVGVVRILGGGIGATRWDVAAALGVNDRVVLAKLRRLVRKGLLAGCWCGCRGDFSVVEDSRCPRCDAPFEQHPHTTDGRYSETPTDCPGWAEKCPVDECRNPARPGQECDAHQHMRAVRWAAWHAGIWP